MAEGFDLDTGAAGNAHRFPDRSAEDVAAVKFDAPHQWHPIGVSAGQFGERVAAWPRGSVTIADVEAGRMASGLGLAVPGRDATPRLAGNPAAAALVTALGGTLP